MTIEMNKIGKLQRLLTPYGTPFVFRFQTLSHSVALRIVRILDTFSVSLF